MSDWTGNGTPITETTPAVPTDQEMLNSVKRAIMRLVSGNVASYKLADGSEGTYLDLSKLRTMERVLENKINSKSNGTHTVGRFNL